MIMKLPFRYTDRHSTETTTLINDGKILRTVIRGVSFSGDNFDQLEPDPLTPNEVLVSQFVLNHNRLCSCVLEGVLPMHMVTATGQTQTVLEFRLCLGDPAPNGGIDRELLRLSLVFEGKRYITMEHQDRVRSGDPPLPGT